MERRPRCVGCVRRSTLSNTRARGQGSRMFRRAHDIPAYALLTVLMTVRAGCFASSPSEMELYPTMGAEGTVITMSGAEFITSPTMYCRCVASSSSLFSHDTQVIKSPKPTLSLEAELANASFWLDKSSSPPATSL